MGEMGGRLDQVLTFYFRSLTLVYSGVQHLYTVCSNISYVPGIVRMLP